MIEPDIHWLGYNRVAEREKKEPINESKQLAHVVPLK